MASELILHMQTMNETDSDEMIGSYLDYLRAAMAGTCRAKAPDEAASISY